MFKVNIESNINLTQCTQLRMRKVNRNYKEKSKSWLAGIDQFPNIYATRISYNSKMEKQTLTGAFCTILLVIILIGITIVYMIPVINKENYFLST